MSAKNGAILVVGGAGYIGSQCCRELSKAGYEPVTLDNLSTGHKESVKWGPLIEGGLGDPEVLDRVFAEHRIRGVMHFAAFALVGESMNWPGKYYENNVAATLSLLEAMTRHGVGVFIFSSTAATFGNPVQEHIDESHPQDPINPYGASKLMVERILKDYDRAHGLRSITLRYFNAAGADPDGETGERHDPETHLIPLVLDAALGRRPSIKVYGTDYDTPDGTCVRDYIHTADLCGAHILALDKLLSGAPSAAYNLGNGNGFSVLSVIEAAKRVTGKDFKVEKTARRPGDPPRLVASSAKARTELGWSPKRSALETIIADAWRWAEAAA